MVDHEGQKLLKMLEVMPIAPSSIDDVLEIIGTGCNLVENWDDLSSRVIMKIFGKREAERKAVQKHFSQKKRDLRRQIRRVNSVDEIKQDGSHCWRQITGKVSDIFFLNQLSFFIFNESHVVEQISKKQLFIRIPFMWHPL